MIGRYEIASHLMSVVIHVAIFGGLFLAFDFPTSVQPAIPLAIEATLVTEAEIPAPPPPPVEREPEPEPEPDNSIAERARLEEEKRQADLRAEQERIRLQQEEDRRRREAEEAERRRRQEEETERLRVEAERRRQEEVERQRAENERLRREAEEAEIERRRQQELDAEQQRLNAIQANETTAWIFALSQAISRNWVPPASTPIGLECVVDVRLLSNGTVASVNVGRCNVSNDDAIRRSIRAAVELASPLPIPDNPRIFQRDLRITFKPEQ